MSCLMHTRRQKGLQKEKRWVGEDIAYTFPNISVYCKDLRSSHVRLGPFSFQPLRNNLIASGGFFLTTSFFLFVNDENIHCLFIGT